MKTGRFVLLLFVTLVPCFALWTLLNPLLIKPAVGLAHIVLSNVLPDTIAGVTQNVNNAVVFTFFGELNGALVADTVAGYRMGLSQDTRLLSYALPFYTALYFTSFRLEKLALYGWGIVGLYIALVLGLVSVGLKDLMLSVGPATGLLMQEPWQSLVGLSYQFFVLIMPTLAPVALWMWQNGHQVLISHAVPDSSGK